jgi:hypothetical protein
LARATRTCSSLAIRAYKIRVAESDRIGSQNSSPFASFRALPNFAQNAPNTKKVFQVSVLNDNLEFLEELLLLITGLVARLDIFKKLIVSEMVSRGSRLRILQRALKPDDRMIEPQIDSPKACALNCETP